MSFVSGFWKSPQKRFEERRLAHEAKMQLETQVSAKSETDTTEHENCTLCGSPAVIFATEGLCYDCKSGKKYDPNNIFSNGV